MHWTVVAGRGRDAGKCAFAAVHLRCRAVRSIAPLALHVGHEAHAVDAVAVVEAVDVHAAMRVLETRAEAHVQERIAVRRAFQRQFENVPLFGIGA